jgi:excisionase family DNA binding protein
MPSPFLLLEEVAEETRTPLSTVRHWIATGKLASVRPGRRRLVRRIDLEAFLASVPTAQDEPPAAA